VDCHLASRLWIPRRRAEVFAFALAPDRLAPPAPGWAGLRLATPAGPVVEAGTILDFRFGGGRLPFPCRVFIREYDPPVRFVAVQLRGLYGRWEHRQILVEQGEGTLVDDLVRYQLRGGPLGRAANAMLVARLIERAWARRYERLAAEPASPP
jgi:ligand-binding SRPBCC domain-containing protein